jgi:hypothetical protein
MEPQQLVGPAGGPPDCSGIPADVSPPRASPCPPSLPACLQGRAYQIKKPMCHITIKVKESEA